MDGWLSGWDRLPISTKARWSLSFGMQEIVLLNGTLLQELVIYRAIVGCAGRVRGKVEK